MYTDFDKNRSISIDSVRFYPEKKKKKIIPTLVGVGSTNAKKKIELDRYSSISSDSTVLVTFINPANKFEGWKTIFKEEGAWIRYNSVDFGSGNLRKAKVRVNSLRGGTLTVCAGKNDVDNVIAKIEVSSSRKWSILDFDLLKKIKGLQDLFVKLEGNNPVQVDWISFE